MFGERRSHLRLFAERRRTPGAGPVEGEPLAGSRPMLTSDVGEDAITAAICEETLTAVLGLVLLGAGPTLCADRATKRRMAIHLPHRSYWLAA